MERLSLGRHHVNGPHPLTRPPPALIRVINFVAGASECADRGTYPTVPAHPALQKKPAEPNIRTMAARKHQPMLFSQHAIQFPSSNTRRGLYNPIPSIHSPLFVISEIDQDGLVAHTPRRPGVAPRTHGNAAFAFLCEFDGRDDIFDTGGFHDRDGIAFWSSVVEDSADAGLFIDDWISRVAPGDVHGYNCRC